MPDEVNGLGFTFEQWMRKVDQEVDGIAGISVYDLADCTFYDWFEDDVHPRDAAEWALENEDFQFDELDFSVENLGL